MQGDVCVDLWNKGALKSLVIPGGLWLLLALALFQGKWITVPSAVLEFCYYAIFGLGILLAWRFHSSRILFTLLTLLLAHRALEFFSAGRMVATGPGRAALEVVAVLLPLNFIILAIIRENGLALSGVGSRLALLFFESVFVAVLCRPGAAHAPGFLHPAFLGRPWTATSQFALFIFAVAFILLLVRFLLLRKPVESGLLWSLAAAFLALQADGIGRTATAYFASAGFILVSSIIENSYLLAYHDELTTLPARRAFNEAVLRLQSPYAVAVVDIDHFKRFNDIYGHETGDQVLRMVAGRLAQVSGGGRAYRVGGEEFTILFPGKSLKEVQPHLEQLRSVIEVSTFHLRGAVERRSLAPVPNPTIPDRRRRRRKDEDRRSPARKIPGPSRSSGSSTGREISVTVSIGIAEPNSRTREPEQVIQAADKALYRAKRAGRNRVEAATPSSTRSRRETRPSVA